MSVRYTFHGGGLFQLKLTLRMVGRRKFPAWMCWLLCMCASCTIGVMQDTRIGATRDEVEKQRPTDRHTNTHIRRSVCKVLRTQAIACQGDGDCNPASSDKPSHLPPKMEKTLITNVSDEPIFSTCFSHQYCPFQLQQQQRYYGERMIYEVLRPLNLSHRALEWSAWCHRCVHLGAVTRSVYGAAGNLLELCERKTIQTIMCLLEGVCMCFRPRTEKQKNPEVIKNENLLIFLYNNLCFVYFSSYLQ